MPDRPPRQLPDRPDPGGADMSTQIDLGWADPQPEPPPPEPDGPAMQPASATDEAVALG